MIGYDASAWMIKTPFDFFFFFLGAILSRIHGTVSTSLDD